MSFTFEENEDCSTVLEKLKQIFDEEQNGETKEVCIKNLPFEAKKECVRYALERQDLNNPYFISNILSFVRNGNTLDSSYFESENVIASDLTELIDLKVSLNEEFSKFTDTLSLYFLSILKTYAKFSFSGLEPIEPLPNLYKNIIMSSDILTLCGIFNSANPINTKDCVYIQDSVLYLNTLIAKSNLGFEIMAKLGDFNV